MENFWSVFIIILSILNYAVVLFLLFFERKGSARRFAWILTLSFLPGIGLILYIIFSGHFFTRTRRMEEAKLWLTKEFTPFMEKQKNFFENEAGKLPNPVMNEYASLIDMNLTYANSPMIFTNSADIFIWGKDKFEALFRDIEKAEHFIFMQYFTIRNDKTGTKLWDLLCKKAQQGVEVKVLYDDLGSFSTPRSFFEKLDTVGGMSLPFFSVRTGNFWSVNFRNHRKIVVIDNKIGYTGGFNVGDEYAGLTELRWRDTHIRLTGNCVLELLGLFLVDWYAIATGKKTKGKYGHLNEAIVPNIIALNKKILADIKHDIPGDSHIPTQIISSGPDDRDRTEIKDAMIRMIMTAKKSIFLQTPYFTPDTSFYSAVKVAALSGIDVRIMVPGEWDKFYVRAAAFAFIREMIPFGVTFYRYPGFIHAKAITIDGKILTVGSCNIDCRSFELHYETNVIFYDEPFAQKYEAIFLDDQKQCEKYELSWFNSRPIFQRGWWSFCRLFSPLL